MRVLVVDDEPLALDRMTDLLGRIEDVELVGASRNGLDAIRKVAELEPDLLLLDIEMPRFDGFDTIEGLLRQDWPEARAVPLVCFVTAYPQFAAEAFDSGALDFLCKPVRLARLEKAIVRARTALRHREAAKRLEELSNQLEELRRARAPAEDQPLWVQQRGETVRLDIAALDWVKAEGEYVRLHSGEKSYLMRGSISAVCESLEGSGFVRIHRSVAINPRRLRSVKRSRAGARVVLDSGTELPVGRKFRDAVQKLVPL